MQIALIAAFGRQMTIGHEGEMPWPRPGDLRRFKQLTLGKTVLMGRRTYESVGSSLPGRTNIVMSRQDDYRANGCLVADSIGEVEELTENLAGIQQLVVIGGAEIYEQFLPRCDRMYLTVVYHDFEGDRFFPSFSPAEWLIEQRMDHAPNEQFDWPHTYFTLRRNRDKPMSVRMQTGPSQLPELLAPIDEDRMDFS